MKLKFIRSRPTKKKPRGRKAKRLLAAMRLMEDIMNSDKKMHAEINAAIRDSMLYGIGIATTAYEVQR